MRSQDHVAEFTAMVDARWPALVRAAMLLGASRADAEDVAQEALTRCFQQWERVQGTDNREAYVHRILVNAWIDRRRRRSASEIPTSVAIREVAVAEVESAARIDIERALGRLSEDQRAAVVLRYYLDLSEKQTAAALGVPAGTVKSRLARGLAALGGVLAEERGERS